MQLNERNQISKSSQKRTQSLPRKRIYLKSTYSMLLKLGVLKDPIDTPSNPRARLSQLFSQGNKIRRGRFPTINTNMEKNKIGIKKNCTTNKPIFKKLDYKDPVQLVKQLLGRAIYANGFVFIPKLSDASNPILNAAERLLLKSETIKRKRTMKYEGYSKNNASTTSRLLKTTKHKIGRCISP